MASWEEFSRIVAEAKASKKLDPVGHEDDDVDNDGDSDSSDSYLKKRRATVGAAIAADRKKKVSEALDPVGHEDKDIDNDGDHDKSDKYLLNRRKVRAKVIPPQERLKTDRDMFNIPKSEQEAARERILAKTKAKRMKEEVEQIDEIAPLVVAGGLAAAAATPYLLKKFAKPAVDKAIDKQRSTKPSDYAVPAQKGGLGAITARMRTGGIPEDYQQNSYQPEGQMVDENKEHDREMRKAAARERAEEKREKKEGGKKSAKSPGRLGKSAGSSYADYQEVSIKAHDKATKGKYIPGMVKNEETEYIEEGGMSKDEMLSAIKGHKYSKKELLDMSKKSTKEGRHGEASAFYHEFQKEEVETIEEKALSRAQQRFMGMVYAAKKGETPASPEVAKAASGMSKKAARDFAKTKHEGLPEKKEDVKESMSLVEKILDEALKGTIAGGKSRAKKYKIQAKDVRIKQIGSAALSGDKKQVKKLKKANENPTLKITEKGSVPKKSEEERKEAAKKEVKRGKSDPSANVRSGIVRGVIELKKEKEKTKRQRERQEYEKERRAEKKAQKEAESKEKQEKLEASMKEKRIKAAQDQSDKEEARKEKTRKDIKSAYKKGIGSIKTGYVSDKESDLKSAGQALSNVGAIASGVLKTGKGIVSAKLKERGEKKKEEKRAERHEKIKQEMNKEQFSNWREEFIFEVDDQSTKQPKEKKIDVMKGKNQIEINPNMSEENIQEIAPLVGILARVAGGAATRGIAARGAGFAARGALQKKAVDIAAQKGGEMTADMVQKRLEKKFKNEDEDLEEGMTLKDFKKKRSAQKQKEKRAAEKTSPLRRAGIHDDKASPERAARHRANVDPDYDHDDEEDMYPGGKLKNPKKIRKAKALGELGESAAWTKKEGKSEAGGLNEKGRKSYERENPGSDLKAPSKKVGNPRRASFCARMSGMKAKLTSKKTANDPDSRINKSLRAWNC